MQITTPSGYKVEFKDQNDLTYGDRRAIQRGMMSGMKVNPGTKKEDIAISGDMVFVGQDATLKVLIKSIIKPDGTKVTGDLFDEVMSWKNDEDGEAVYKVVTDSMLDKDDSKKKSPKTK